MKLYLICIEEDKENAGRLLPLLRETGFVIEVFAIKTSGKAGNNAEKQLISFFASLEKESARKPVNPSRMLIFSSLSGRCFDFLAGYSFASKLHSFLVFGKDAIACIPKEFSKCFTSYKTEKDLLKYVHEEYEAYKAREAERELKKAHDTLLKMGIPVNLESLIKCTAEGSIHEVILFLAAGFSPDAVSEAGVPLLSIAARKGARATLRLLIHSGANLNQLSTDRGTSALLDSAMGNHSALAIELIKAGADVDIKNKSDQTALIVAVGAGNEEIVEALLKAGSEPDIKDSMGVSARQYATLFRKEKLINLFNTITPLKEG